MMLPPLSSSQTQNRAIPDSGYAAWVRGNVRALRQSGIPDAEIGQHLLNDVGLPDSAVMEFMRVEPTGPLNLPPAVQQALGPVVAQSPPWIRNALDLGMAPPALAPMMQVLGIMGPDAAKNAVGAVVSGIRGVTLGATDLIPPLKDVAEGYRGRKPVASFGVELISSRYNPLAYVLGIAKHAPRALKWASEAMTGANRAKTVLGGAGKAAVGGGITGGVYGLTTGQDVESGLLGAVGGTVGGGVLGTVFRPLENIAFRHSSGDAPHGRAMHWLVDAFKKDRTGSPAPGMFGPDEVPLDQGGAAVKGLINMAASRSPVATNKLQAFIKERTAKLQEGVAVLANDVAGVTPPPGRRVANVVLVADEFGRKAESEASKLYAPLERVNAPIPVDDDLAVLMEHPAVERMLWGSAAKEFEKGRVVGDIARGMTGTSARGLGATPRRSVDPVGRKTYTGDFDWRRLDLLKKQIDDRLAIRGEQALAGQARDDLVAVKEALVGKMDRAVRGYQAARLAYGGPKEMQRGVEAGWDHAAKGADATEAFMAGKEYGLMSNAARTQFKLGILANIQKQIGAESRPATEAFWDPDRVRLLQMAAKDTPAANSVPPLLAILAHKDETLRGLSSRAGTTDVMAEQTRETTAAQAAAAMALGRPGLAARVAVTGLGSAIRPMNQKEADSLAEWLLERPVTEVADYFNKFMSRRAAPAGRAAGLLTGR